MSNRIIKVIKSDDYLTHISSCFGLQCGLREFVQFKDDQKQHISKMKNKMGVQRGITFI